MENNTNFNITKIIGYSVLALFAVIVVISSATTVKAGQIGIKTRFGAVTGGIMNPGLHFKTPFIEGVTKMDVQNQKEQQDASAASADLQTVSTTVALNYSLNDSQIVKLYSSIGVDYKTKVIDPAIQEAVKATTANYNAEELITKRESVGQEIKDNITAKLQPVGITVDNFSIINFNFSPSFNDAIEAKVTAEQNALAAKNKLAQVQFEAQQAVEEAKGKAQALTIEGSTISANPQVLQLRAIEKWNGVLPQVTSGGTPFINIK